MPYIIKHSIKTETISVLYGLWNCIFYIFIISLIQSCHTESAEEDTANTRKEKIILESDMNECFDDGVCMMMLAKAPNIDLLGVTSVRGNTWAGEGAADAIRQLEIVHRTDIPVFMGDNQLITPNRFDRLEEELRLYAEHGNKWTGYPKTGAWDSVYQAEYGGTPSIKPSDISPEDFIINKVKEYPGEITLVEIGPCTTLAKIVSKAPEIVPLIKRVVYMGGAFYCGGNTTDTSEFNWWYDPTAAKEAIRTPFKRQDAVGLDVCNKTKLYKNRWDGFIDCIQDSVYKKMMKNYFITKQFEENPNTEWHVWDLIASAIVIDSTIVKEYKPRYVDVCDTFGPDFGRSIPYESASNDSLQKINIVMTIDTDRFWKMLTDFLSAKW